MKKRRKYVTKIDQYLFGYKIPKGSQFFEDEEDPIYFNAYDPDGRSFHFLSQVHSSLITDLKGKNYFDEVDHKVIIKEMSNTVHGIELKCNYALTHTTKNKVKQLFEQVMNSDQQFAFNIDNQVELLKEDLECAHLFLDNYNVPRKSKTNHPFSLVGRIKMLIRDIKPSK